MGQQNPQSNPSHDTQFRFVMFTVVALFVVKAVERFVAFYHANSFKFHFIGGMIGVSLFLLAYLRRVNRRLTENGDQPTEVLVLGKSVSSKKPIYFSDDDRILHMQVIGATRSGKTYFIVSPIICRDIESGNGCLIVDGKSDASFLEMFDASVDRSGRTDARKLLLADHDHSDTYNPFFWGTPEQITERFFSAFPFENPFYRAVQFNTLLAVLIAIRSQNKVPTPALVYAHAASYEKMKLLVMSLPPGDVSQMVKSCYIDSAKYQEYNAGLISYLSQLCMGGVSKIFNATIPSIRLEDLYKNRAVLYIQIPTLQYQTIGPALGRMVLLEMMQVISVAQVKKQVQDKILSIVLDDFNDFIFEGFGSLLNKSASARIGVVFSHQSMGDLTKVSPAFKNVVTTNTNQKIILRTPDPETAEELARTLGTRRATKQTARAKETLFGHKKTGDVSERDVEEFLFHPNVLKSELVAGEGIVLKTTKTGTEIDRVKFAQPLS